jgi:guanine nucleotide-binding protein subunit alpha
MDGDKLRTGPDCSSVGEWEHVWEESINTQALGQVPKSTQSSVAVGFPPSCPQANAMPVPVDPLDELLRPPPDEPPEERAVRLAREEQARQVSAAIDASIKAERIARRKKRIVRLLLLGQSESGGSMFFCTSDI